MFGGHKKKGAFGGGDGGVSVSLNLTALMDVLSNLLFFLLASYQTQEIELKKAENLALPSSTSDVKLVADLMVAVLPDRIDVAGVPVAHVESGEVVEKLDTDGNVPGLLESLKNAKAARAAAGQDGLPGSDTILLLADKKTDSEVVARVLRTAGTAGFPNVRFGVIAK